MSTFSIFFDIMWLYFSKSRPSYCSLLPAYLHTTRFYWLELIINYLWGKKSVFKVTNVKFHIIRKFYRWLTVIPFTGWWKTRKKCQKIFLFFKKGKRGCFRVWRTLLVTKKMRVGLIVVAIHCVCLDFDWWLISFFFLRPPQAPHTHTQSHSESREKT